MRTLAPFAENDPLTGYEPNDYHIMETNEPYIQESSGENGSLNNLEYDDVTIGIALSSPVFTQEREDAVSRRRAYQSQAEGFSSSLSLSVSHGRTESSVVKPFDSFFLFKKFRDSSEHEQIRILLERQREQNLADCQAETRKHEFQADCDRSTQQLNGVSESQKKKFILLIKETNDADKINNFFRNTNWHKIGIFVKLMRSLSEMEELKRCDGATFDTISRKD